MFKNTAWSRALRLRAAAAQCSASPSAPHCSPLRALLHMSSSLSSAGSVVLCGSAHWEGRRMRGTHPTPSASPPSTTSFFQAFSPLEALRPTRGPIAGDAVPFVRPQHHSGSLHDAEGGVNATTTIDFGHEPPQQHEPKDVTAAAVTMDTSTMTVRSSHPSVGGEAGSEPLVSGVPGGGAASRAERIVKRSEEMRNGAGAFGAKPQTTTATDNATSASTTSSLRRESAHGGGSNPYTAAASSSTPSDNGLHLTWGSVSWQREKKELKRAGKKVAMKLSSLLVNHHHHPPPHDMRCSERSAESGSMSALGEHDSAAGRGRGERKRGWRPPPLPVASTAQPFTAPASRAAGGLPPHPAAPHPCPTETVQRRVRTGFDTSAVSPAVLRAQAAIAEAEAAKAMALKQQEAEKGTSGGSHSVQQGSPSLTASSPESAATAPASTCTLTTKSAPRTTTTTRSIYHCPDHQYNQCKKLYREHRLLGWSPAQLYEVVSDVTRYHEFLPWCVASEVHSKKSPSTPSSTSGPLSLSGAPSSIASGLTEMTASLTVGFAFFKENYTSHVTLDPPRRVIARLHEPHSKGTPTSSSASSSNEGFFSSILRRAARSLPGNGTSSTPSSSQQLTPSSSSNPILRALHCEWELLPDPQHPNQVEVQFAVAFEFRHPMYGNLIMSNIVSLMTSSFESRCEALFGPPSQPSKALPL